MSSPGDAAEQLRAKDEQIAALEAQLTVLNKTLEISEYAKMKARVKAQDSDLQVAVESLHEWKARTEAAEKENVTRREDAERHRSQIFQLWQERDDLKAKLAAASEKYALLLLTTAPKAKVKKLMKARRAPEAGPAEGGEDAKRVHSRGDPTSTTSEASRSAERGHDETTTEE